MRPLGDDRRDRGQRGEPREDTLAKVGILFDGPPQLARPGPVHQPPTIETAQVTEGQGHVVALERPERVGRGLEQGLQQVIRDGCPGVAGRLGHDLLRDARLRLRTVQ